MSQALSKFESSVELRVVAAQPKCFTAKRIISSHSQGQSLHAICF